MVATEITRTMLEKIGEALSNQHNDHYVHNLFKQLPHPGQEIQAYVYLSSYRTLVEKAGYDIDLIPEPKPEEYRTPQILDSPLTRTVILYSPNQPIADMLGTEIALQRQTYFTPTISLIPLTKTNIEQLRLFTKTYKPNITPEAITTLKETWDKVLIPQEEGEASLISRTRVLIQATPSPTLGATLSKIYGVKYSDAERGWIAPRSKLIEVYELAQNMGLKTTPELDAKYRQLTEPFPIDGRAYNLKKISLSELSTLDDKAVKNFEDFGILNIYDLLMTAPRRYIDRTNLQKISDIRAGMDVAIIATIKSIDTNPRKRMVKIQVTDGQRTLPLTFFNALWQAKRFKTGDQVIVTGKADEWISSTRRTLQMNNPLIDPLEEKTLPIIPVYPQSEKSKITTWDVQRAVKEALLRTQPLHEIVPQKFLNEHQLETTDSALRAIHTPHHMAEVTKARRRLAFNELLTLQLGLLTLKEDAHRALGSEHKLTGELSRTIIEELPFPLTAAQERVWSEIEEDLSSPHPMHRLLQGDVGAGKAQPLTALILTPNGYVPMGSLTIGQPIMNPFGEDSVVTGIYPQGKRPVYQICFSDNTEVECDIDHLWHIAYDASGENFVNITTENIMQSLKEGKEIYIPYLNPLPFNSGSELDTVEDRLVYLAHILLSSNFTEGNNHGEYIVQVDTPNGVAKLRSLGCILTPVNESLPKNTQGNYFLHVPSSVADMLGKEPSFHVDSTAKLSKKVKEVIYLGEVEQQCITVSHPNQLYITNGFTPTHNTVIAALSLAGTVESGFQGALMAPTEILATQLYAELISRLEDKTIQGKKLRVELLTNKIRGKTREKLLLDLASGDVDILVGTHALIVDDVEFKSLGVVVVDEQHRFGVEQRSKLRDKGSGGNQPDMLVMTATPIPRTAAMTVFGDLDVSVLDELPPGRTPILTRWIDQEPDLQNMTSSPWKDVLQHVENGNQAYVICPLVEESEKLEVASAVETYENLSVGALAGVRVGLVHGQQKSEDRSQIMEMFRRGELDVLVSTTVIEVGVNVPNASIIVILDSGRFGIAQLHQLRGRVGRGTVASECILVGRCITPDSRKRMEALCESTDGFYLSEVDLELRGHGSLFGTQQSGVSDLKVADISKDQDILELAREYGNFVVQEGLESVEYSDLRAEVNDFLGSQSPGWLMKS